MRALQTVVIVLAILAATASAELARAPRAIYDPATETTVQGTVVKVIHTAGRRAGTAKPMTTMGTAIMTATPAAPAAPAKGVAPPPPPCGSASVASQRKVRTCPVR